MEKKIKILYIDDEYFNTQLFDYNFSSDYEVIVCQSGEEGLVKLGDEPDVDVVICDMRMPNMNGIDFINKARKKHKKQKYFMLTGHDVTPDIKEAINKGLIIKYFSKPFDMDEIVGEINKVV